LAKPSTGGDVTLILYSSPSLPATSFLEDLGVSLTKILADINPD
jgi:hypothetical protein